MFKRTKKAFTLLELIVAVTVLGILAAIAIPTYNGIFGDSRAQAAFQSADVIARQANGYAADRADDETAESHVADSIDASGKAAVAASTGATSEIVHVAASTQWLFEDSDGSAAAYICLVDDADGNARAVAQTTAC